MAMKIKNENYSVSVITTANRKIVMGGKKVAWLNTTK